MDYGYYPGCSMSHSARPYDISTQAVAAAFDIHLNEIDDWNCCGATEYIALNKPAAYALVGRNLALAAQQNGNTQVVAPCSACFLNLRKANHYMAKYPKLAKTTNFALEAGGLHYEPGSLRIRHLLDVIYTDVGLEAIEARVTKPLTGLKIAPYYGCLIVRPEFGAQFDDTEQPTKLDELLRALGAEVVDFPLKATCCGGHMTQISDETAFSMLRRLFLSAADNGADMIVTICPMCQLNLDAYQGQVNRHFKTDFDLPVLYFTQMIGLAIGMSPRAVGIGYEIVSADMALAKIGSEIEEKPARKPRGRKRDKSIPMPRLESEVTHG
ncbi:MAG: CoB--CoM heterodisulfide reductase iron-sulfur subunit B family protein [Anaerolineales bacterium]